MWRRGIWWVERGVVLGGGGGRGCSDVPCVCVCV